MNRWIFLISIAIILSIAACAPAPTVAPLFQIKIGYTAATHEPAILWVAKETGLFQKNGIAVTEMRAMTSGTVTTEALCNDDLQFAEVSAAAVVDAPPSKDSASPALAMIASLNATLDYDLVVQPGMVTREDLRGKKFAVSGMTGSSAFVLRYALREYYQLDPDKDAQIIVIGNQDERIAALQNRAIDGTVLIPESATRAKKNGQVVLMTLGDKNIPYQGNVLAVRQVLAQKNPALARALIKTIVEGIAYFKDASHRDQIKRIMAQYLKTDDALLLENAYNDLAWKILQSAPYVNTEGVKMIMAQSQKSKGLPVTAFVNNTFIQELEDSGYIRGLAQ